MKHTKPLLSSLPLTIALVLWAQPAWAWDDGPKPVEPAPGVDKVEPMEPDWCPEGFEVSTHDSGRAERTVSSKATEIQRGITYWDYQMGGLLDEVAINACLYPKERYVQEQVAAWRQQWLNATGISEKDNREHLKVWVRGQAAWDDLKAWCEQTKPRLEWRRAGPQPGRTYILDMERAGVCDTPFTGRDTINQNWRHAAWLANPLREPSQRELLGFAHGCVPWINRQRDDRNMVIRQAVTGVMYCGREIDKLDRDKLLAELAALSAPPAAVTRYMELFTFVQRKVAEGRRERDTWAPNLPKKVREPYLHGFEIGMDQWTKLYEANKAAFDLGFKLELALDEALAKAEEPLDPADEPIDVGGCDDLHKAWMAHLGAKKPKEATDVVDAAHSPVGYFLGSHLALCLALQGGTAAAEARVLESLLWQAPQIYHGPHLYAGTYIFAERERLKTADIPRDLMAEPNHDNNPVLRLAGVLASHSYAGVASIIDLKQWGGSDLAESSRAGSMAKARVKTVKKTKDGVAVTFKKESWTEPNYECVNLGFHSWDGNGKAIYNKKCKVVSYEKKEFKWDPITFVGSTAALLKPNMMVKFATIRSENDNKSVAYLVETNEAKALNKPMKTLSYLGVPLKR